MSKCGVVLEFLKKKRTAILASSKVSYEKCKTGVPILLNKVKKGIDLAQKSASEGYYRAKEAIPVIDGNQVIGAVAVRLMHEFHRDTKDSGDAWHQEIRGHWESKRAKVGGQSDAMADAQGSDTKKGGKDTV